MRRNIVPLMIAAMSLEQFWMRRIQQGYNMTSVRHQKLRNIKRGRKNGRRA